jgi:hypothetical protein
VTGQAQMDPVDMLTEVGFNRAGARLFADELRGPVTDGVVRLLPGINRSRAGFVVAGLAAAAAGTVPVAVSRIDPALGRHESTTLLPVLWLMVVANELNARAARARNSGAAPAPSGELSEVRRRSLSMSDEILRSYLGSQSLPAGRLAAAARVTAPEAGVWGGWATYAALGLTASSEVLPQPGRPRFRMPWNQRTARLAGAATALSTAILMAAAEELIPGKA